MPTTVMESVATVYSEYYPMICDHSVCCRVDAHFYTHPYRVMVISFVITITVQHWTVNRWSETFVSFARELRNKCVTFFTAVMRETAGAEDHMEGSTLTTY